MEDAVDPEWRALAHRFLNVDRWRPDSDDSAATLVRECVLLFGSTRQLENMDVSEVDEILFNASFDLQLALFSHSVAPVELSNLVDSICELFTTYYAKHVDLVSCQQFWDNILGYADGLPAAMFLNGALGLLSQLLARPETHLRASALHGLNHHPALDEARAIIESHLGREADSELQAYGRRVLAAFEGGHRLV